MTDEEAAVDEHKPQADLLPQGPYNAIMGLAPPPDSLQPLAEDLWVPHNESHSPNARHEECSSAQQGGSDVQQLREAPQSESALRESRLMMEQAEKRGDAREQTGS